MCEQSVEPECVVPCELDVLFLVLADGYEIGADFRLVWLPVEEYVWGHEDWVGVQAEGSALRLLLLELGHHVEPVHGRNAGQDPRQFQVLSSLLNFTSPLTKRKDSFYLRPPPQPVGTLPFRSSLYARSLWPHCLTQLCICWILSGSLRSCSIF